MSAVWQENLQQGDDGAAELDRLLREMAESSRLADARRGAFGDSFALYEACFEADNGTVPELDIARRYVCRWEELRQKNVGLLLWGGSGSGKTFAAACIADALLRQDHDLTVRMRTFAQVLSHMMALEPRPREQYRKELTDCDLLILDDFGMERQTEYAREQLFDLIDGRYLAKKPLIVTTNLSLRTLKDAQDLDRKRIYDRVLEMCVPVRFHAESLRTARAAEKMNLLRAALAEDGEA